MARCERGPRSLPCEFEPRAAEGRWVPRNFPVPLESRAVVKFEPAAPWRVSLVGIAPVAHGVYSCRESSDVCGGFNRSTQCHARPCCCSNPCGTSRSEQGGRLESGCDCKQIRDHERLRQCRWPINLARERAIRSGAATAQPIGSQAARLYAMRSVRLCPRLADATFGAVAPWLKAPTASAPQPGEDEPMTNRSQRPQRM